MKTQNISTQYWKLQFITNVYSKIIIEKHTQPSMTEIYDVSLKNQNSIS